MTVQLRAKLLRASGVRKHYLEGVHSLRRLLLRDVRARLFPVPRNSQ